MRSFPVTDAIRSYAVAHGTWRPDPVIQGLQAETAGLGDAAGMQIGDDQGQLLTLLARLVGARRAVEVGTFTGYSSLCIARGLAEGGSLLCCDVSAEWTEIGRRAWASAGLDDRIELRIAPALDTLRALPTAADIDLVFIDADKPAYAAYWAELVPRVRPGGLLLADNVLWSGRITDPEIDDANTVALRAFNDLVVSDDRVETVVLTAFDGLTIARQRLGPAEAVEEGLTRAEDLRVRGAEVAALVAHGAAVGHGVGPELEQRPDGGEELAAVVEVDAGDDDTGAATQELVDDRDVVEVEHVHLVDGHDVELLVQSLVQARDLRRREHATAARGDAAVTHVPLGLVDAVADPRELQRRQQRDESEALARLHRPEDDVERHLGRGADGLPDVVDRGHGRERYRPPVSVGGIASHPGQRP